MKRFPTPHLLALCAALAMASLAHAGVSKEEADKLKTTLTPMGAERAGNKEGTIPAWTGGLTKESPRPGDGRHPADPFASEKPLLTITAQNADQHIDKLTEGAKFLLKSLPGYKINVYPSHRTAAAPQWVYDNTYKNALNASVINDGLSTKGASAGVPFPLPKRGEEVMHNINKNWRGTDFVFSSDTYVMSATGKRTLASSVDLQVSIPYYYQKDRKDPWDGKVYSVSIVDINAPAYSAGERSLTISPADYVANQPQGWSYLTGQRRLRKTPNVQYDVPFPYTSGLTNFDDANGFLGSLDRYDWKLIGKQEIYTPYNNNSFYLAQGIDNIMQPQFVNPDLVRWELHRVWVVEANVKPTARHNVPRKRFYVDEDTWWVMQTDQWDAKGQFWKSIQILPQNIPSVPVTVSTTNVIYNVQQRGYVVFNSQNRAPLTWKEKVTPADEFTAQALERGGSR